MNGQLQRIVFGVAASVLAVVTGCLPGGCALFTSPGEQIRQGMEQSTLKEWRADGGFWAEAKGTQTERYTMAQGRIVLKENEDGEAVIDLEESVIEYYLTADPSARDSGTAMGQALEASTAQAEVLGRTVSDLVGAMIPLLTSVPAVPPGP